MLSQIKQAKVIITNLMLRVTLARHNSAKLYLDWCSDIHVCTPILLETLILYFKLIILFLYSTSLSTPAYYASKYAYYEFLNKQACSWPNTILNYFLW